VAHCPLELMPLEAVGRVMCLTHIARFFHFCNVSIANIIYVFDSLSIPIFWTSLFAELFHLVHVV
jgi:hypothetical protein